MEESNRSVAAVTAGSARNASVRWEAQVLRLALVASVLLNLVFAFQIRRLQKPAAEAQVAITGVKTTALMVATMDGHPQMLDLSNSDKPTVVYYFRPGCHWCARNLANIAALTREEGTKYKFVGLAPRDPSLKQYVADKNLPFPVFSVDQTGPLNALKLSGGTPQTLVVAKNGIILANWPGAYAGKTEESVDRFFQIKVPGLLPDAAPR
jgi:hypothetical protein